jgi:hypothetical protein
VQNPTKHRKTILEIDLISYSDIARILEENLNVEAVKAFEDQIQSFVDFGLEVVGVKREETVLGMAGDNAILVFDTPELMHTFAEIVHLKTVEHNQSLSSKMAHRWFRMGASTGVVMVLKEEKRVVGSAVARAVRLEAASNIGEVLIDVETYDSLPPEVKKNYGSREKVKGKRDETFHGHRCLFFSLDEGKDKVKSYRKKMCYIGGTFAIALFLSLILTNTTLLDNNVQEAALSSKLPTTSEAECIESVYDLKNQDKFDLSAVVKDVDGWTYLRKGRSTSSDIITTIPVEEVFFTYYQDSRWWKVKTVDGIMGYVHVSRIVIQNSKK